MDEKTKIFIKKCQEKYGDKFDYSKVVYTGAHEKVEIGCRKHGYFTVSATNFLQRGTCPRCGKEPNISELFNIFLAKAKKLYGEKYSYEKVEYKNCSKNIIVTCKEHGDFSINPSKFTTGEQECPKCTKEKNRRVFETNFKKKLFSIFGDHFDTTNLWYKNEETPITLICKEHGPFTILPTSLLKMGECPLCKAFEKEKRKHEDKEKAKRLKIEKKEKIAENFFRRAEEIHKGKYDYRKSKYVSATEKICIICPEHGEFWQTPNNHLNGKGCPKCSGKFKTTDEFIKEAQIVHGKMYDYSKVVYERSNKKVCIICPEHGEFWQTPNKHLGGHSCPKCNQSHLERDMSIKLSKNGIKYIQFARFPFLGRKEYDFYLPSYNIAIECQGTQHFNENGWHNAPKDEKNVTIQRDIEKNKCSTDNGITLFYVLPKCIKIETIEKDSRFYGIYNRNNVFYSIDDLIKKILCIKLGYQKIN